MFGYGWSCLQARFTNMSTLESEIGPSLQYCAGAKCSSESLMPVKEVSILYKEQVNGKGYGLYGLGWQGRGSAIFIVGG